MMPNGMNSSNSNCKSASHKMFKDKAKIRLDDLQNTFSNLQYAMKESSFVDVAAIEEQMHQMIREWKAELHEPSPASSLQDGGSLVSFGSEIERFLKLGEEEDDATSSPPAPKPEPDAQNAVVEDFIFHEEFSVNLQDGYHLLDEYKGSPLGMQNMTLHNMESANQLESYPYQLPPNFEPNLFTTTLNSTSCYEEDAMPNNPCLLSNISPPPSAFLGPKCALWDCPRPAQALEWSQEYCSGYHTSLALNEGPLGMPPVVRPGGIGLKDGLLFAALSAKSQGKDVGIPECEGAATAKSPWNASELFDVTILEGETIREWLFFDKPRRAFESGTRKQRSLPDYTGRGWHESRKQVVKEYNGLKRCYYMDPQPWKQREWHLYEYEINKCDACALYRLELKVADEKKTPKGKAAKDPLADLQKQMGRLSAEVSSENKPKPKPPSGKGRSRLSSKNSVANVDPVAVQTGQTNSVPNYDTGTPDSYLADILM